MECKFWVGQKVVKIPASEDIPSRPSAGHGGLVDGQVYTIREIFWAPVCKAVGVRLVEKINRTVNDGVEIGYYADLFRPATDITIFKEIVAKVKDRDLIPVGAMR